MLCVYMCVFMSNLQTDYVLDQTTQLGQDVACSRQLDSKARLIPFSVACTAQTQPLTQE